MRNKKARFILVFVLVSLILSLSSCKKNNGGNSFVSSLLSSNNSDVDPLVNVTDPNSQSGQPIIVESIQNDDLSLSQASSALSSAESSVSDKTKEENEEEVAILVPDTPSVISASQSLYVIEDEIENALSSDDVPLIETDFSYKGIEAKFYVFSTFTRIILPEGTTDDDIALCVSLLCDAYPEETKYVTYQKVDGWLVLTYPRCDKEYLSNIVNIIVQEGKLYIDTLIPSVIENKDDEVSYSVSFTLFGEVEALLRLTPTTLVVTTNRSLTSEEFAFCAEAALSALPELNSLSPEISEKGVSFTFERLDDEALSDLYSRVITLLNTYATNVVEMNKVNETTNEEEVTVVVEVAPSDTLTVVAPVSEKGRKVLSFEVGLNGSVYYDFEHNLLRASVDGRFGWHITDKFLLGAKSGYDWGNYAQVMGYLEYNITKKIYLFAGVGYKFGLNENTDYSSFLAEAGVGFEHNIASSFFVFGEISVKYAPHSYSKLTPSLSLGFNYKFSF